MAHAYELFGYYDVLIRYSNHLIIILYEVFKVQLAVICPTALTELLSVIRNLIFMKPLIAHKISFLIWQPPTFPYRHQYSIIGRLSLNHRVRDVDGCFPKAHRHQKIVSASQIH